MVRDCLNPQDELVSEEIEVEFTKKPGPPTAFLWRRKRYEIKRCQFMGRRLDFGRRWWQRHHKDFYLVEDEEGNLYEIYFNRGPGRKYWVLYKIIYPRGRSG